MPLRGVCPVISCILRIEPRAEAARTRDVSRAAAAARGPTDSHRGSHHCIVSSAPDGTAVIGAVIIVWCLIDV